MTMAEKSDIKQYQIDNYLISDKILYQIKEIDYKKNNLSLVNEETKQTNLINLDKLDKTYLQYFTKNNLEISKGELIKFTRNDKENNIANNDEFIVKDIKDNKIIIQSIQKNNKNIIIDNINLTFIDYAYTKTIHSSQGLTADKTILELDYRSPTTTKNVYYVAVSRARNKVKIYTNDIEKTKKVVEKACDCVKWKC